LNSLRSQVIEFPAEAPLTLVRSPARPRFGRSFWRAGLCGRLDAQRAHARQRLPEARIEYACPDTTADYPQAAFWQQGGTIARAVPSNAIPKCPRAPSTRAAETGGRVYGTGWLRPRLTEP